MERLFNPTPVTELRMPKDLTAAYPLHADAIIKRRKEFGMKNALKVYNKNGMPIPVKVTVNGCDVPVCSIDYRTDIHSIPVFTLEISLFADIEVCDADIQLRFHPDTVKDAVKVLRNEIITDKSVYNGFVSSIESALNEAKPYTKEHDLAVAILDRIIGEEYSKC